MTFNRGYVFLRASIITVNYNCYTNVTSFIFLYVNIGKLLYNIVPSFIVTHPKYKSPGSTPTQFWHHFDLFTNKIDADTSSATENVQITATYRRQLLTMYRSRLHIGKYTRPWSRWISQTRWNYLAKTLGGNVSWYSVNNLWIRRGLAVPNFIYLPLT